MQTIEYRVQFSGATGAPRSVMVGNGSGGSSEIIRVQAININAGFTKALKKALEPLGNGQAREIADIQFWQRIT